MVLNVCTIYDTDIEDEKFLGVYLCVIFPPYGHLTATIDSRRLRILSKEKQHLRFTIIMSEKASTIEEIYDHIGGLSWFQLIMILLVASSKSVVGLHLS